MITWLTIWFFGALKPELRLLPFRRWFISWAFRCRWVGLERLSNLFWRAARIGAIERTHPALAAYTTKMIMGGVMEGRE